MVASAIEFANDGGWHVGDEEARLQYLAELVSRMSDRDERVKATVELAHRYKRNLLYIARSMQDIELCA